MPKKAKVKKTAKKSTSKAKVAKKVTKAKAKSAAKPKAKKGKVGAKGFDCVVIPRGNLAFAHNNNAHKNHMVTYRIDSNMGPFPQVHQPVPVAAGGERQLGTINAGGGQWFRYTITGET